jgi:chemotaxis protein CheX
VQVEHINPFVDSLVNTFQTMLGCDARRGNLSLADPVKRQFPISGVIGLSGNAAGMVVINLSEEVAMQSAAAMLMMDVTEVDDDVLDAVGELANMVAGAAKAKLEEFNLSVSLPNIVTGENHEIRFPSSHQPICVPFETDFGPLRLEVGFEPAAVAATV